MTVIDWSKLDDLSESTVDCTCGQRYRTHARAWLDSGVVRIVTRKPCPACGCSGLAGEAHGPRRVASDPEEFTIGRPKTDR